MSPVDFRSDLPLSNIYTIYISVQVKAPWIKTFFYCGEDTYIIPGVDYVTLGGSRTFGATSLSTDEYESKAIWERCTRYVPSLKRAEVRNSERPADWLVVTTGCNVSLLKMIPGCHQ